MKRAAVFFDRDGTLIVEREGYLTDPDQVELIEGAATAVADVNAHGRAAVLVTNQSAVARGLLTLEGLAEIHERLETLLSEQGARLDAIYFCPHGPDSNPLCLCRKPAPGMLTRAAKELDLNLSASFLVGDDGRDIAAARAAGVSPILVLTGKGRQYINTPAADKPSRESEGPAHVASNVAAAVDWILKQGKQR